jgi:hypothetical protein
VVIGALPSIRAHVNRFLPKDDPRRAAVEEIATGNSGTLEPKQRDELVTALHAANAQRRRDLIRVRSFRTLVICGTLAFFIVGIALGIIGSLDPTAIPLCFTPEDQGNTTIVCPQGESFLGEVGPDRVFTAAIERTVTSSDLWLVEFLGLIAAALAGAAALRNLKGSSTPYAVPVTLILFKLPTGAVTAVVGLLLMRAEFVPGLSALDSSGQILGWAIVFGIAQQLVTRWVDSQASGLLENVGGRGAAGDRPLKAQPSND